MGQMPPFLQPGPHSTCREGRSAPQAAGEPSAVALVGPAAQTAPPPPVHPSSMFQPQPSASRNPHPHPSPALVWVPMAAGTHFCNSPGTVSDFSVCPRQDRARSDFSCGPSIQHGRGNY